MDLVAWIVGREDGAFGVVFAPSWADRMPAPPSVGAGAGGRALRRKSAPLVSRWLPHPIAYAELEDEALPGALPGRASGAVPAPAEPAPAALAAAGAVQLSLVLSLEGEAGDPVPLHPPGRGALALATTLAEMIAVVGDLLEALALPLLSLAPDKEARGLDVVLGSVGGLPLDKLAEHLCLFRAALDVVAQARGLIVERASVLVAGRGALPLDARLPARLDRADAPR